MDHHFYIELILLKMQFPPMSGSKPWNTALKLWRGWHRYLIYVPEACPPLNCAAPLVLRSETRSEAGQRAGWGAWSCYITCRGCTTPLPIPIPTSIPIPRASRLRCLELLLNRPSCSLLSDACTVALRSFTRRTSTLVCTAQLQHISLRLLCTLEAQPNGALELTYNRPKWNYLVQTSFNLTNAQGQQLVQQYYNYFEHFLTPFNICTS